MSNESKGMLLGLLGVIAFGLTLPVTRFIVPYFDPIFIGLGRAVIAAVVAGVLLLITKQPLPSKNQFYKLCFVSLGVVVGFPVLSSWAMETVPASHGGVVVGILPLATAMAAILISHERPSLGFWITGVIGSLLVIFYALLEGAGTIQLGDIALLGAIISAAIGYAVGGQLSKDIGGWQVICWALVIALPFIILPAASRRPEMVLNIPMQAWFGFLYLALVSQLLAFFFWNKGLALGGIARVSQVQFVQPFITIVAAAILVKEPLSLLTIVVAILVISMVAIGKRMPISEKI